MHSFWFGWKSISDSTGSTQPHVKILSTAKGTIMRFFALALVGELMAGPAGEYLAAIENSNSSPTLSRGTSHKARHGALMADL
jgi:hypothetical protein